MTFHNDKQSVPVTYSYEWVCHEVPLVPHWVISLPGNSHSGKGLARGTTQIYWTLSWNAHAYVHMLKSRHANTLWLMPVPLCISYQTHTVCMSMQDTGEAEAVSQKSNHPHLDLFTLMSLAHQHTRILPHWHPVSLAYALLFNYSECCTVLQGRDPMMLYNPAACVMLQ